jgi:alginate O-acetyltransferase complex protein AlgI
MLLALLGAIVAAPIYWYVVPEKARKDYLAIVSAVALGVWDVRIPALVLGLTVVLYFASRAIAELDRSRGRLIVLVGFALLTGLFCYNKLMTQGDLPTALATSEGIVLVGMSYFVLKAASILIETYRRALEPPNLVRLMRWLVYFPIYTAGPIEDFNHFDAQEPKVDRRMILSGFERILWGCVRALLLSHYIAEWASPIIANPERYGLLEQILAMYGGSLRIYFDFAGYSDIAIGLSALYGYKIQENFDNPLLQRNIGALWQRWHMTLTGWMRIYLFTPYTRKVMKWGRRWHYFAIVTGQIITMLFCGLWHTLTWGFALWGFCHALALSFSGLYAKDLGKRLPKALVRWWRKDRLAHGLSVAITFNSFALINVLAVADPATAGRFYLALFGISQ